MYCTVLYYIDLCTHGECADEAGKWPKAIVDVGCGIGGSSRYLAAKFGATRVVGITLSPVQAARANALSAAQGLAAQVSFSLSLPLSFPALTILILFPSLYGCHRRFLSRLPML